MVKFNNRSKSTIVLNSSDLYLNSVIDMLMSSKKKECNKSMNRGITFVGLIQLCENQVGQIIPLVCKNSFDKNDNSGINLRRCNSTLCFNNKFPGSSQANDVLFSNQRHETAKVATREEFRLNVSQKIESTKYGFDDTASLSKDVDTHISPNKNVNTAQYKNAIRGQLTSGIAPNDLRASIYNNDNHNIQNNLIYKKKDRINEENNLWKLSQKEKGPQHNKMYETFHLNHENTQPVKHTNFSNRDTLSVIFSGGSSLQSNEFAVNSSKGKQISSNIIKSITVSKSLLNEFHNAQNLQSSTDSNRYSASLDVDAENVVSRDRDAEFPIYEKENTTKLFNQTTENAENNADLSTKFKGTNLSGIPRYAYPSNNSFGTQIPNKDESTDFDVFSNSGPSCNSFITSSNEHYFLKPSDDNLVHTYNFMGDSSGSESLSLDIDYGNEIICNKLENLMQELRQVFVYRQRQACTYPMLNYFSRRKQFSDGPPPKKCVNVQGKGSIIYVNVPVNDLPASFVVVPPNEEVSCPGSSKSKEAQKQCDALYKLVIETPDTKCNKAKTKCCKSAPPPPCEEPPCCYTSQQIPKSCVKPSKIPLKKRSSQCFSKMCFSKCFSSQKAKCPATLPQPPNCSLCNVTNVCCARHINHPNCECCSKCIYLIRQVCNTAVESVCCARHTGKPDCTCCSQCVYFIRQKEASKCINLIKRVRTTSVGVACCARHTGKPDCSCCSQCVNFPRQLRNTCVGNTCCIRHTSNPDCKCCSDCTNSKKRGHNTCLVNACCSRHTNKPNCKCCSNCINSKKQTCSTSVGNSCCLRHTNKPNCKCCSNCKNIKKEACGISADSSCCITHTNKPNCKSYNGCIDLNTETCGTNVLNSCIGHTHKPNCKSYNGCTNFKTETCGTSVDNVCCLRHTNKPNCKCCNDCIFIKREACGTSVENSCCIDHTSKPNCKSYNRCNDLKTETCGNNVINSCIGHTNKPNCKTNNGCNNFKTETCSTSAENAGCIGHANKPNCNTYNGCNTLKTERWDSCARSTSKKVYCEPSLTSIEMHSFQRCNDKPKQVWCPPVIKDEDHSDISVEWHNVQPCSDNPGPKQIWCPSVPKSKINERPIVVVKCTPKETSCQTSTIDNEKPLRTRSTQTITIRTNFSDGRSSSYTKISSKTSLKKNSSAFRNKARHRSRSKNDKSHSNNTKNSAQERKSCCNDGKITLKVVSGQTSIFTSCSDDKLCHSTGQKAQPPTNANSGEKKSYTTKATATVSFSDIAPSKNDKPEKLQIGIIEREKNLPSGSVESLSISLSKKEIDVDHLNDKEVQHLSKKLVELEKAYNILLQCPDTHTSKKHANKPMTNSKKRDCLPCSTKCKRSHKGHGKGKETIHTDELNAQREKIMKDVAGGVEVVLESLKEFKKLVNDTSVKK